MVTSQTANSVYYWNFIIYVLLKKQILFLIDDAASAPIYNI